MVEKKPETKAAGNKSSGNTDEGGEGADKKEGGGENSSLGNLASPEGFLMMTIAVFFDAMALIPVVGTISDIVAGIFFIMWTFTKPEGGKKLMKFFIALILGAIPVVSDITPFVSIIGMFFGAKIPSSWVGYVYSVI